jgi:hypothetical protein
VLDRLLNYLWDSKDIQATFIQDFIIVECTKSFKANQKEKAVEMMQMVI